METILDRLELTEKEYGILEGVYNFWKLYLTDLN